MPIKTDAVGKEWPATTYEVGKEKIREYATVIGFESPVYFDREAARAAGYRDVVAPPMFAVVPAFDRCSYRISAQSISDDMRAGWQE